MKILSVLLAFSVAACTGRIADDANDDDADEPLGVEAENVAAAPAAGVDANPRYVGSDESATNPLFAARK